MWDSAPLKAGCCLRDEPSALSVPNLRQMSEVQADEGDGLSFTARVAKPESGWKAYLVECAFPGPEGFPLVFTTQVYITPDTLPFADKKPE